MKKIKWNRVLAVLLAMVTAVSLLSACGSKSAEKEDADTITVYLWSTSLYEKYAPYIQKQLPDINVEFVVGNNDLDFYRFLKENGKQSQRGIRNEKEKMEQGFGCTFNDGDEYITSVGLRRKK